MTSWNDMRIALITTTINVPKVLNLYDEHQYTRGALVRTFVAGDLKTPDIKGFCDRLKNCVYLHPEDQKKWKCSELLGWNTITRRNIALLEALKWGAEIIITIDDDNIPLSPDYFRDFAHLFSANFNGLSVTGEWFDAGKWQYPDATNPVVQRGFPQEKKSDAVVGSITNAKIGLAQGIILGDPDTSAIDRISQHPLVHTVSELFKSGAVVAGNTWTVCNTQNTAVLRKFAPALLCCPQFGRYDDIFASLICQRIMRKDGYVTHFGQPFVWQERNPHNLIVDLRAEFFGMTNIVNLARILDSVALSSWSTSVSMYEIYEALSLAEWFPKEAVALAEAFMDDVESVL